MARLAAFNVLRWFWNATGASGSPRARQLVSALSAPLNAVVARRRGFHFGPYCDGFTRLCYLFGWYERETVAACEARLRPGMTVLDIGAHLGYYTRFFAETVGPTGRVYAFEPHPETFALLRRNTAIHRNVVTIEAAVTDRVGEVDFFEMSASGQHSVYPIAERRTGAVPRRRLRVHSTTVDAFLAERGDPPVDLIKMDIEGAEPRALAGMARTVARLPRLTLVVEWSPEALAAGSTAAAALPQRLHALDFQTRPIGAADGVWPPQPLGADDGHAWVGNLLCEKGVGSAAQPATSPAMRPRVR